MPGLAFGVSGWMVNCLTQSLLVRSPRLVVTLTRAVYVPASLTVALVSLVSAEVVLLREKTSLPEASVMLKVYDLTVAPFSTVACAFRATVLVSRLTTGWSSALQVATGCGFGFGGTTTLVATTGLPHGVMMANLKRPCSSSRMKACCALLMRLAGTTLALVPEIGVPPLILRMAVRALVATTVPLSRRTSPLR